MSCARALLPAGSQILLCMWGLMVTLLLGSMLTWPGCLLRRGHRTRLVLRETAARLKPLLWFQAGPAWKQTPLLTGAPAKLSRLKLRILNRRGNPAVKHTSSMRPAVLAYPEAPEICRTLDGRTAQAWPLVTWSVTLMAPFGPVGVVC